MAKAPLIMMVAVCFFGLVPLVISWGVGDNPFLFSSGMRLGVAVLCAAILLSRYMRLLRRPAVTAYLRLGLFRWEVAAVVGSYFDFAILAVSARLLGISASAVLYELWPIVLILIVSRWTGRRYQGVNPEVFLLLLAAFAGVGFILFSQASNSGGALAAVEERTWRFWAGSVLAVAAAVVTALTGFSWVWSHRMLEGADLQEMEESGFASWERELFFLLVALVVTNLAAVALNQAAGWVWGAFSGEFVDWSTFGLAVIGGVFSYGVASVSWRIATSHTADLGIHALSYATPVFSLLFLF